MLFSEIIANANIRSANSARPWPPKLIPIWSPPRFPSLFLPITRNSGKPIFQRIVVHRKWSTIWSRQLCFDVDTGITCLIFLNWEWIIIETKEIFWNTDFLLSRSWRYSWSSLMARRSQLRRIIRPAYRIPIAVRMVKWNRPIVAPAERLNRRTVVRRGRPPRAPRPNVNPIRDAARTVKPHQIPNHRWENRIAVRKRIYREKPNPELNNPFNIASNKKKGRFKRRPFD